MRIAAIDMGSNTTLMLICDVQNNKITKVISDHSEMTRLSQELQADKLLKPEALDRLDKCLAFYREIMSRAHVEKVVAVATSAARDAKNQSEFFRITDSHAIPVQIISGDQEAKVTFVGSTFDVQDKEGVVVIDIGGGSTEIVAEQNGRVEGFSLNVGSVRMTEQFFSSHPVRASEVASLEAFLRQELIRQRGHLPEPKNVKRAVAVAGTPTTLAMILQQITFDEEQVHGFVVTKKTVEEWLEKLAGMSIEQRCRLIGMHPKRADVMVAGLAILSSVLQFLELGELTVSTKGVRYGLALLHDQI
jgi:exopolyphosphatase/guanosine-5'-triphosphate,3'-diphosphate pyrophosphatase